MKAGAYTSDLRKLSRPEMKNISVYKNPKSPARYAHPVPLRGASAVVTTRDGDAVDVEVAPDERGGGVRQRRVVLTSRCWRQCFWETFDFPGRYGGKRAVLRGEHAISRKATAQGMSDVLRCPVCSCAHFLVHDAHEIAGAARIRHSLRPLN